MTQIDLILWWSTLPIATLLLSPILLRLGLRSKRLDDHPTCRRCDYDLIGAPPDSPHCPECGADIRAPKAIRIGRRTRRPALVAISLVLFLASLAALTLLGRRAAVAWQDDANKPAWWLTRQLASKEAPLRDRAFAELNRRFNAATLTPAQTDSAAEQVLKLQGDLSIPWNINWGFFIETARLKPGSLSDAHWQKYAQQAGVVTLRHRQNIRRGDPIPIDTVIGPSRVGLAKLFTLEYKVRDATVDGQPLKTRLYWQNKNELSTTGAGWITQQIALEPALLDKLADGPHRLEAVVDVEIYDRTLPRKIEGRQRPPPITKYTQPKRIDWTLVSTTTETVTLLRGQTDQELVRSKVRVDSVEHRPTVVFVALNINNLPFDFAADLTLRDANREWPGGTIIMNRGSSGGASGHVRVDDKFNANFVDVILKGSPRAARATPDMTTIWGGELTLHDVPVKRNPK